MRDYDFVPADNDMCSDDVVCDIDFENPRQPGFAKGFKNRQADKKDNKKHKPRKPNCGETFDIAFLGGYKAGYKADSKQRGARVIADGHTATGHRNSNAHRPELFRTQALPEDSDTCRTCNCT